MNHYRGIYRRVFGCLTERQREKVYETAARIFYDGELYPLAIQLILETDPCLMRHYANWCDKLNAIKCTDESQSFIDSVGPVALELIFTIDGWDAERRVYDLQPPQLLALASDWEVNPDGRLDNLAGFIDHIRDCRKCSGVVKQLEMFFHILLVFAVRHPKKVQRIIKQPATVH